MLRWFLLSFVHWIGLPNAFFMDKIIHSTYRLHTLPQSLWINQIIGTGEKASKTVKKPLQICATWPVDRYMMPWEVEHKSIIKSLPFHHHLTQPNYHPDYLSNPIDVLGSLWWYLPAPSYLRHSLIQLFTKPHLIDLSHSLNHLGSHNFSRKNSKVLMSLKNKILA